MNVAGSGRSRRCTTRATTSAPAVSTSSSNSSSWPRSRHRCRRDRHPDQHDLLPDPPFDQRGAERLVIAHGRHPAGLSYLAGRWRPAPSRSRPPDGADEGRRADQRDPPWCGSSRRTLASPPSMCTVISPAAGSASPQLGGRPRRRAGTGPAGLGDPGTPLVDAHGDGGGSGPGSTISRLTSGTAGRRCEIDGGHVLDGHERVGIAEAEVGHGPMPSAPTSGHEAGASMAVTGAHVDAGHHRVGLGAGGEVDPSRAGVGGDDHRAPLTAVGARPALDQAPDAVAAHLGPAAVRVVEPHDHRRPWPPARHRPAGDEETVGADPTAPVAHVTGRRGPGLAQGGAVAPITTRKSFPSPWCLVRVRDAISGSSASTSRSTARPSSWSTPPSVCGGRGWNQRSWRTANAGCG